MKSLAVSLKILREYIREPLLLGLIFAFPVILLFFYYIAFGETDQGMAKHFKVLVINQDEGTQFNGEYENVGTQFVQEIKSASFEGNPIFDVIPVKDQEKAEITLREHKAGILMIIPTNFSNVISKSGTEEGIAPTTNISFKGYPTSDLYVFSKNLLESMINDFNDRIIGIEITPLLITYEFIPGTGTMSDFEFGVPGLIVFGVMFLTISTAMTMVREEVNGTLNRLRISCITAKDLFLGTIWAQLVICILLVLFTFGTALLMGFKGNGSVLLAIIISILLGLSAVGLGLITACFARNDGEAANLSAIIGVMMVIVSGAMYPMPSLPLATIGGRTIQLYDLLPPAHASEALRRILIFGDDINTLTYEISLLSTLAVLILISGFGIYQRKKLN